MEAGKRKRPILTKEKIASKSPAKIGLHAYIDPYGEQNPEDEILPDDGIEESAVEAPDENDEERLSLIQADARNINDIDLELPDSGARASRVVLILTKVKEKGIRAFMTGERSYDQPNENDTGKYYSRVRRILQYYGDGFFEQERALEPEDFFGIFKTPWFFGEENTQKTNRRFNTGYAMQFWTGERVALNFLTPKGLLSPAKEAAVLLRISLGSDADRLKKAFCDVCREYANGGILEGYNAVFRFFDGLIARLDEMNLNLDNRDGRSLYIALKKQPFFGDLVKMCGGKSNGKL